jgi:hypothetical protein
VRLLYRNLVARYWGEDADILLWNMAMEFTKGTSILRATEMEWVFSFGTQENYTLVRNKLNIFYFFEVEEEKLYLTISKGEWERDCICGQGILYFPCGGYLHGFFKNNKVHGYAKLLFPNSDIYIGEWSDGKLNGKCFKQFVERNCWLICEYKAGVFKSCLNQGKGDMPQSIKK